MAATQTFGRVKYLLANTLQHTAWDIRPSVYGVPPGPGVAGYEDYRVIQRQAGANMTVDVGTTAQTALGMTGWVTGSTRGHQGIYECATVDWTAPTTSTYAAQINVDVAANASGNPRLDIVVLEVLDLQHVGTGSSVQQIRVITGTPTAAATLDNRNGAPALPATCILLADILVPNAAASIGTADIRDRRAFPFVGAVPPLLTKVEQVLPLPSSGTGGMSATAVQNTAAYDQHQGAVLVTIPKRIVGATRLRWRYTQGATANAGNYNIGIYDASGRLIVSTGAIAYVGAANSFTIANNTIAATTFEAGQYYIGWGNSAGTAGATVIATAVLAVPSAATSVGTITPNVFLRAAAGGTTLPTTLLAMTDVASLTATTNVTPVPIVALSVG
jgi:hypothetical protein